MQGYLCPAFKVLIGHLFGSLVQPSKPSSGEDAPPGAYEQVRPTKTLAEAQMPVNAGGPGSQAGAEFVTEPRGISMILCSSDSKGLMGELHHSLITFQRTLSSQMVF